MERGKVDPIRDANQSQHGRDAHAPLAFVSRKLSFQHRISEFSEKQKNAPCGQDAFFTLVGNLFGSRLAGVKFDGELFVDDGIDFLACGDADDAAAEVVFVHQKPIRNGDNLGELDAALGEAGGFVIALDGNDITGLEVHGRDVGFATVHRHMTMADHLAGATESLGEAHFLNDIVEAGLKELKEDFTGHTTAAAGDLEVAAELALEDSILVTELLFLSKSD